MPLVKSGSKKAFVENIKELYASKNKRPKKQMLAIAYANQQKYGGGSQ